MTDPPKPPRRAPSLRWWLASAVLALVPVWGIAQLLSSSVEPMVFESKVDRAVVVPGSVHRSRSEAWARSTAGRFGIWGVPDITAIPGPKVAIWGNSQVEGLMLPDDEKIAQQVTARWQTRSAPGVTPVTAYGVGIGGVDIATPHRLIPSHAAAIEDTVLHVIVFANLDFILPRDHGSPPALRATPQPRFESAPAARPSEATQAVIGALHPLRLDFAYHLAETARDVELRWHLGRAGSRSSRASSASGDALAQDAAGDAAVDPAVDTAWNFLLDEMARQAGDVPVAYVYAPPVPVLDDGRLRTTDPDGAAFAHFARLCEARGIVCRSLEEIFVDRYQNEGVFPRGFALHNPYRGHLNRHGAGLVADAIAELVADALHPG